MTLWPTDEVVAVAWLKAVVPGGLVATVLPSDNSSWSASGFVQVGLSGGDSHPDFGLESPVVGLDFWAVNVGGSQAPWGKAEQLAMVVRQACLSGVQRDVSLPAAFGGARVLQAWMLGKPRRLRGDPAGYAHFTQDMQFRWVGL